MPNDREIKNAHVKGPWKISYTHDFLQIGCEGHLISEWWEFDDERISQMDKKALTWWKESKSILKSVIEEFPATAPK